jgi:murein DD-endopeptidase MepM/ murein hydrolase activator NlpD
MVIQKVLISGIFYSFRYCHLIENFVNHGQAVKQGDLIGIYGDVGYSFGAHLHIDVSPGDYFDRLKIINPCSLFTEAEFKQIA